MRRRSGWNKAFAFLGCLLFLASCGVKKELAKINRIPCKELIEKVEKGGDFPEVFAAKYACEVSFADGKNQKFGAILRSEKNRGASISISPLLGIEIFKIYLFEDSVVFLDKIEKTYYSGTYNYLSEKMGTPINLDLIQDLVSAKPLKYKDSDKYRCDKDKDFYIVKNVPSRKLRKGLGITKGENYDNEADSVYLYNTVNRKLAKALKKDDDIFVKRYFADGDFNLKRVVIHEVENNRLLEIKYDELQNFSGTFIPRLIELELTSAEQNLKITINPSKFKVMDSYDESVNIPEKYERISMD
ncbi:DUF4292 domain-containing protein [Luteibaculum oceani]|uniref:DUF4292 domain-containing protein n=1 Tax=Luteibaculum oceani TaxID=1294296 RepID=A0A5C6VPQ8_9FLAO|nr:DUF4292 domain-containing protein [Luteibaculum oceani]TXC85298.1 DUF4292 domain-containing protein [Luteibaculum oceani]